LAYSYCIFYFLLTKSTISKYKIRSFWRRNWKNINSIKRNSTNSSQNRNN